MAQTPNHAACRDPATLPPELFHDIAKEFPARERFRYMRVSRRWAQALTNDKLLWTDLDSADYTAYEHRLQAFSLADGCLKTLRFSGSSAEELMSMAVQSPRLDSIYISTRGRLIRKFSRKFMNPWPAPQLPIKELFVDCQSNTSWPSIDACLHLVRYFGKLSKLAITDNYQTITGEIVWPWLNACRQLHSLSLTRHACLVLTPSALYQLCRTAPNLKSLELNNIKLANNDYRALGDTAFELQLPGLTDLKLVFINPQEWLRLPSSLKRLQIHCCERARRPKFLTKDPPFLPALEEFSCDYDFTTHGGNGTRVSLWQSMMMNSNCQLRKLYLYDTPQGREPDSVPAKELITFSDATLAAVKLAVTQLSASKVDSALSTLVRHWDIGISVYRCVALSALTTLTYNHQPGDIRVLGIEDDSDRDVFKVLMKIARDMVLIHQKTNVETSASNH